MTTIKQWPAQDRPREKLLQCGAAALTDTELVAIFIRTGLPGKSAIDLAREALHHFGGLPLLLKSDAKTFCHMKGLGQAKYVQLQAALEITRRALQQQLQQGQSIQGAHDVVHYLQHHFQQQSKETLMALFLDNQNRIIAMETLAEGTIDHATLYPRHLLERVLVHQAKSLILAHNHPSGDPKPSAADHELTDRIRSLLKMIDVILLDHVIVGAGRYYAFSQQHITMIE